MIITRSWLSLFVHIDNLNDQALAETFVRIGHEVASVRRISFDHRIVVGHITSCKKHPDADKLSVCIVDVGTEKLQIVCGASNVAQGQFVPVATIGATLPDGLTIKDAQLRGVQSSGMICSAKELGLPPIGEGIMPLDHSIGDFVVGDWLGNFQSLADTVLEVELTANRGDCLSVYGLARDLSAALDIGLVSEKPDLYNESAKGIGRILRLSSDPDTSATVMIRAIENNGISAPLDVKLRLGWAQIAAKSAIAQLIAYAIHSTGVLFRAFDFAAFVKEGEEHGEIRLVRENGLNTLKSRVVIDQIGIKGNDEFAATDSSRLIILEAFFVQPDEISRASFDCKLKGDYLHQKACKGSEPELQRGMRFFYSILGGNSLFFSEALSYEPPETSRAIAVNIDDLGQLIGEAIDKNLIANILKRLGADVHTNGDRQRLLIAPASWRHDLQNPADIAEEVLRIIGIDTIEPKPLLLSNADVLVGGHSDYRLERRFAARSAANGFHESLHFLFCDGAKLEKFGFTPISAKLDISNPIAANLNALRPTLLINLLDAAALNNAKGRNKIALFEIADVVSSDRNQKRAIAFVYSGDHAVPRVENHGKGEAETLFDFARKISRVVGRFELASGAAPSYLQLGQSAAVVQNGETIGFLGKLAPSIERSLGLKTTFVAEFDLAKIKSETTLAKPISKLQPIERDISVLIDKRFNFAKIKEAIVSLEIQLLKECAAIDLYEDESMNGLHSLTFRLVLRPYEKTPTEDEITALTSRVLNKLTNEFGAALR
ncbi:phenylalanine--tRNA ligase beta subunit [Campylobacterota bacterium]|nr:phenylalanine--tRNA ligase beta subunit [Campylobacterota bacterium]